MKNVSPVTLMPGDYMIVAKGYNANELNGNSFDGVPYASGDLGNGAISYIGRACMALVRQMCFSIQQPWTMVRATATSQEPSDIPNLPDLHQIRLPA
jgi:hypothetical protein